jgi:hypothetical protein
MNLRAVANRLTSAINPNVAATVQVSTGYTTGASGKQVPNYAAPVAATVQMQALTKKEIEHLDSMNLSQTQVAIYADMQLTGVDRTKNSGGDLVTIGGDTWLVTAVLEGWTVAGWCKVAATRQMP